MVAMMDVCLYLPLRDFLRLCVKQSFWLLRGGVVQLECAWFHNCEVAGSTLHCSIPPLTGVPL